MTDFEKAMNAYYAHFNGGNMSITEMLIPMQKPNSFKSGQQKPAGYMAIDTDI